MMYDYNLEGLQPHFNQGANDIFRFNLIGTSLVEPYAWTPEALQQILFEQNYRLPFNVRVVILDEDHAVIIERIHSAEPRPLVLFRKEKAGRPYAVTIKVPLRQPDTIPLV